MGGQSAQFLVGAALLLVVLAPLVAGARAMRARFLPTWRGPVAMVADAVLVLDALTAIGLLLGLVGALERWTLVGASVVLGGGAAGLLRSADRALDTDDPGPAQLWATPRPLALVAASGVGLVVAQWIAQSLAGLRTGMRDNVDTLWYHVPMAASFAATGSTTAVHHFDLNPVPRPTLAEPRCSTQRTGRLRSAHVVPGLEGSGQPGALRLRARHRRALPGPAPRGTARPCMGRVGARTWAAGAGS